jgi:single-stranded-DNA-specific exonuclease
LAEEVGRPVVVVTRAADPWRGSARAPAGFDLADAFTACGDLFERFGGHAAAAGCSLLPERFEAFRDRFGRLAATFIAGDARPALRLDLVLDARAVDYALHRELSPLEATGDAPILLGIHGLVVARVRQVNGGHLQVTLRRGREVLDGICFGRAEELAPELAEGQTLDVVARVSSRAFGGFESLQLEIRDLAPAGTLKPAAAAA